MQYIRSELLSVSEVKDRVIFCSVGSWRTKLILSLWYCISFISSPLPALVHAYPSQDHTGQCNRNHCNVPGQTNSWKSEQIL